MNIKELLLLLCIQFIASGSDVFAQSAIITSGGNFSNSNGSVSFSVGQPAYISFENKDGFISEGVQQPYEIFTSSTDVLPQTDIESMVYPNPTQDQLVITISGTHSNSLSYQIYNVSGILIQTDDLSASENIINVKSLVPAVYTLLITEEHKTIKSYKIVKNK